uniref:NADH dehydrogenase subunit 6 n=1 Tax=Chaetopleura apiculata TaxID=58794 RepID=A0A343S5A6_CHAAP|nr:NADH dehydrogenase subunit 6 [Chaetopleura apiculata]
MMVIIFSLILSLSFMMLILNQPLTLGLFILFNSFLMSISIYFQEKAWFSFILFLVYIGGMLVMFAYITTLIPNLAFKSINLTSLFIMIEIFWFILLSNSTLLGFPFNKSNMNMELTVSYINNWGGSLFSLFNIIMMMSLASILLFILICVVKICYFSKGPLRPFK